MRILFCYLLLTSLCTAQKAPPIYNEDAIVHPVVSYGGMVVTQEKHASEAAAAILREGGNAIDAAVTAAFSLAVTLPRAGNIGGGGFMLVHLVETGEDFAIDFREMAPAAADAALFTREGQPDKVKTRSSATASGVPGTVRGLALALEKAGTMPLSKTLTEAIRLAEEGIPVSEDLRDTLKAYAGDFKVSASAQAVFFPGGEVLKVGTVFKQAELGATLRRISEQGADEFYTGETAAKIVQYMAAEGGIMTAEDLAKYVPVVRKPLEGTYRGARVLTMPPPSAGGATLLQMLGMLEILPVVKNGVSSAASIHQMTEVMKLAHANRSRGFGDPDFVKVPLDVLLAPETLKAQVKMIDLKKARPSAEIRPFIDGGGRPESHETTHFSVIDRKGNVVSVTYTLNFSYGSRRMVPGTGILLNNEMDDFNVVPGVANAYGLPADEANGLAPGKRMLSSMTPVIAFLPDGGVLATGSPGGSRIPTTVLQVLVNVIDHKMNVAEATHTPRIHHQWQPDVLYYERGISLDTVDILKAMGHNLSLQAAMGSTQTILWRDGVFRGAADPRRREAAVVGVE
jgi:gamma-glutamyltranspeptidase/glutathione hydrolase